MSTLPTPIVRLLAEAAELARDAGYAIREDHLDGAGGGHCVVQGKKWLLLDVTQSLEEQLSDICDALRDENGVWENPVSPELSGMLQLTKAA
ncbi:hypothetical protein [Adhaeretor mobilis]|uniref:Uncharacterized protein n=1 Tax=Adhaeretor mobilis TaxID=1930276 RepID=A0A517MZM0_9BACT|nr:hypothetical protein [Adhaeretor mobilis]QDT00330.1 hypothetical protein HG15A2_36660 [Adhaeretor mobilis]